MNIVELPYDIYTVIFNYLDSDTLFICRTVCQLWRDYIREITYYPCITVSEDICLERLLECVRVKNLHFDCIFLDESLKEKLDGYKIQYTITGPSFLPINFEKRDFDPSIDLGKVEFGKSVTFEITSCGDWQWFPFKIELPPITMDEPEPEISPNESLTWVPVESSLQKKKTL